MAEMGHRLTISDAADGVVAITGELDAFGAPLAESALAARPTTLDGHVDVSALSFVDSAGLQVLVRHSERLRADGASLHLRDASEPLRRLIELTGLGAAFVLD